MVISVPLDAVRSASARISSVTLCEMLGLMMSKRMAVVSSLS